MRYDTAIYLVSKGNMTYNPTTGDYTREEPASEMVMASVMDTTEKTLMLVYGEIRQGSLTIQLQNHYNGKPDYIVIGEKRYAIDYMRRPKLGQRQIYVVTEVQ